LFAGSLLSWTGALNFTIKLLLKTLIKIDKLANPMDICMIYISVPNAEKAKEISNALVNDRLAACVGTQSAYQSTYRWEGKIENDSELLLTVKTRLSLFNSVEEKVKKLHPYKVPEIIAVPIIAASKDYADWIIQETS